MKHNILDTKDYIVFAVYFVIVAAYGIYIYNKKKSVSSGSKDYFLAEGSLTWWAIGASLIASNISAEQFIGMSGSGFKMGLAIATYEWMAALTLIIVAVFFIPVYLKNKIATMPQFLHQRYNGTVAMIMAVFWLLLYVVVNLTSILYLGALAVSSISGFNLDLCMYAIAAFAIIITLGGMKVIGYTDVIQVFFLILGGLATTYLALNLVSDHYGTTGVINGYTLMTEKATEHFHMILKPDNENYIDLPGLSVLVGGMWIVNLNYWGCNQYITQRALGADLKTARTGILFAGILKLGMPIIVMLPGIAAYVLHRNGALQHEMGPNGKVIADNAYSAILTFLPTGLKGLSVAALTAAIVASLAGKANSISTIWTLDIYKKYINKLAEDKKLVAVGRWSILVSIAVSVILTWDDLLGIGGEGGFTFIQKYTGFISPGVFAMFLLGMFWKRTTGTAAIAGLVTGFLLSVVFNNYAPSWFGHDNFLYTAYLNKDGVYEIPFLICMGLSFLFTMIVMVALSLLGPKVNPKAFELDKSMFKVAPSTMVLIVFTLLLITLIYVKFW